MDKNLKIGEKSARPLLIVAVLLIWGGLFYTLFRMAVLDNWFVNASLPSSAVVLSLIGLAVWYLLMPLTKYAFSKSTK